VVGALLKVAVSLSAAFVDSSNIIPLAFLLPEIFRYPLTNTTDPFRCNHPSGGGRSLNCLCSCSRKGNCEFALRPRYSGHPVG